MQFLKLLPPRKNPVCAPSQNFDLQTRFPNFNIEATYIDKPINLSTVISKQIFKFQEGKNNCSKGSGES